MVQATYPPPVDKLLIFGESKDFLRAEKWPDYRELGLGPEHINDLILLATDHELRWGGEDDEAPEVWAPVHAWRALGQLRAEAAIEPLTAWFDYMYDDDWITEELPQVYALIGPAAIAPLAAYLEDSVHHTEDARVSATSCLEEIGGRWPEARDECVAILAGQLELFAENGAELNGFIIASLMNLKAVEAAPVMERAFAAKKVDLMIAGDWNEVQVDLGLKEASEAHAPRPLAGFFRPNAGQLPRAEQTHPLLTEKTAPEKARQKQHATNKARHKQAKASRKKNRKPR